MRKLLTTALAAVTLAAATTSPALAEHRRYYSHHDNDAAAAAVVAGIAGLAIGAALAGSHRDPYYDSRSYYGYRGGYYGQPYYDRYAYAPPYGQGYRYYRHRSCVRERWVWDPYIGREVLVRRRYC